MHALKLQNVDLGRMPSLDSLPVLAALPPRRVEDCRLVRSASEAGLASRPGSSAGNPRPAAAAAAPARPPPVPVPAAAAAVAAAHAAGPRAPSPSLARAPSPSPAGGATASSPAPARAPSAELPAGAPRAPAARPAKAQAAAAAAAAEGGADSHGGSSSSSAGAPGPPVGVSVAWLYSHLAEHGPELGAGTEAQSTRAVAVALKRRMQESEQRGPYADVLEGATHELTGEAVSGPAAVHVAHAWGGSFPELVSCLAAHSGGDVDKRYGLDLFSADLHAPTEDPIALVRSHVRGCQEVLLVLDGEGLALQRAWVLFEALVAFELGKKLVVRCCSPGGFGTTEGDVVAWERRVDAADWDQAETTRQSDRKRLQAYAQRALDVHGRGVERLMAQLKLQLRRDIYGQILIGAVERGDRRAVEAALDRGANPEQQDALGNLAEELAAFAGHTELEELLFERRVGGRQHARLSAFFIPADLAAVAARMSPELAEAVERAAPRPAEPAEAEAAAAEVAGAGQAPPSGGGGGLLPFLTEPQGLAAEAAVAVR